ncbi:MAG: glycoside hydrolase family 5 protein [Lachnospiraceae bacterium]|nr:glycoside hydrolase family 5 protein [Lachnospiraceae bacterium]
MRNIKKLLSIILAFSMVTGMIFFNAGKAEAKQTLSPLHVEGVALADKDGKTVQLRGLSTHGMMWFPQYVNNAFFKQMHKEWGCNVVRAAMYTEEYNGYCTGGKKESRKLVKKAIKYATDNDMYVIVDWHILSDNNPNKHTKAAKGFFKWVAKKYGKQNNIIYEICNEPNGGTSWADIKKYANQVIPVIRKYDPDSVIIVGTPTWSQELDKAAADPLEFDNVVYTLHFYAATHREWLQDTYTNAINSGLPVFVSEFGICSADGNGTIDKDFANKWIDLLDKNKTSYCMWNISNKAEASSIIKPEVTKTSGFTKSDLTTSGKWFINKLK